MGFFPVLINFIVTFSFTIGVMQIIASVMAVSFLRSEIPSIKMMLIHNVVSAVLISMAYTLTFSYLPTIYQEAKLNDGILRLYSKTAPWSSKVVIKTREDSVEFKICSQEIKVKNNMNAFYEGLNQNLIYCGLPENSAVYIDVVKNPFHHIEDMTTNSILRKYLR